MDARDFSGHWVGSGTMRVSDTQVVEERCQMMTITIQQSVDLFKLSDIQFKCGEGEIIGSTISLVVRNGELFWGATPVGRIVGERVSLRYQHSSGEISARLELLPDGTLQFSEDSISDDITYSWTGILGRQ